MKLRMGNLKLGLNEDLTALVPKMAKTLRIPPQAILRWDVVKEAVDARKKEDIKLIYTIDVEIQDQKAPSPGVLKKLSQAVVLEEKPIPALSRGQEKAAYPPVVVGAGPCGLFAALKLAEYGYRPILLERGRDVDRRVQDIANFWGGGDFDPISNVQFGEGGAGTFSDGKLTTRINDPRTREVLEKLVEAGGPEEIRFKAKPHIGTDLLREVVKNLRQRLIALGGRVYFETRVDDLLVEQGKVTGVLVNGGQPIKASAVVLALGHSARDTYEMLGRREVALEGKPFSIGLRAEHPQKLINESQYGAFADHPRLGAAEYQLVYKDGDYGRTAYSFCMCPGGEVVAAASETGGVVTNGMSAHARDSGIANSALVVSVSPEDFPSRDALAGVEFQRLWERQAYQLGGGNYQAPAQKLGDFLADRPGDLDSSLVQPTYRPGVKAANLRDCLPKEVGEVLAAAMGDFSSKIKGFAHPDVLLTGVETRTSAPLRILRDGTNQSISHGNLYPAGEGAGYAGGIVSAAVDGLRAAEALIQRFALPEANTEIPETMGYSI